MKKEVALTLFIFAISYYENCFSDDKIGIQKSKPNFLPELYLIPEQKHKNFKRQVSFTFTYSSRLYGILNLIKTMKII